MNCPACDARMELDPASYDSVMAGPSCPNGCVMCAACGKNAAYPGFDGCAACNLQSAIEEMNAEPFSQENQTQVALWRARLEMERAA